MLKGNGRKFKSHPIFSPAIENTLAATLMGLQASVWLTAEAPACQGAGRLRTRRKSNEDIILKKPSANPVLLQSFRGSRKFSGGALLWMHHSSKDFITTKHTKVTKDSDIFCCKLRALRALRGEICFSCLVAAPPR